MYAKPRRIAYVTSAVAVVLVAGACSSSGGGGASGSTIRIGIIDDFTGPTAAYGQYTLNALKLAQKDYGDSVDGKKIEFVKEDELCTPEGGVNAANKVIGRVVAVVGPQCSGSIEAAEPVLQRAKLPHLYDGFLPTLSTHGDDYGFRINPSDAFLMSALAGYLKDQGVTKIALANGTTAFEQGEADAFTSAWKKLGLPAFATTVKFDTSTTDFSGQLARIQSSGATALVVCAYETPSALIVKQAKQLGLNMQYYGGLDFGDDVFTGATKGAENGTTFVTNYLDTDPQHKTYVDRYKAEFHNSPGGLAEGQYLAYATIITALKKVGTGASSDKLRDAIRSTDIKTQVGETGWTSTGELEHPIAQIAKYDSSGDRVLIKTVEG